MSKSLWSQSVWSSLFNRIPKSRRVARQRRKSLLTHRYDAVSAEMLEERVVPTVDVIYASATDTLTISNNATTGATTVTVKSGSTYTDILVDGKFQTRLSEANTDNIAKIDYTGHAVVTDTLSVIGVNGVDGNLDITLSGTERILLNTKNTTITADGPLAFGKSTVAGTLDVDMTGAGSGDDLTQFGKVSVSDLVTVTTNDGDILFSSSGNSFGTMILGAGLGAISVNEAGPTTLGDSTGNTAVAGASLTVKSTGAITDLGEINISGATTLTASGAITLDHPDSDFTGLMTLKGTDIAIDNADPTSLGNVTATGNFTLTSNGSVSHPSGNVKVTSLATISVDTPASNDIAIVSGTNNFGSLSLDANDISVTEKSAMNLGGLNTDPGAVTATGNVNFKAKGAITDSGEVNVTGTTQLSAANGEIALDDSTSTFTGSLTVGESGYNATNVSIINDTATALAGVTTKGTFSLTSGGAVTQTGVISSVGLTTIDATAFAITLNSANTFGSLSLFGTTVGVTETGGTNLFTSEITGNFTLNSTGGAVIDSGNIDVTGLTDITATGADITLDQAASTYTGAIRFTGKNVAITNAVATTIGDATVSAASAVTSTATGNLTLISTDDITDAPATSVADDDIVAVTGKLTATSQGDVVLDTAANTFGSMSVSGVTVTIVDAAGGLDIVSATATGDLTVTTATGGLTDSGTVTVTGNTTVTATSSTIVLNSAASTYAGTFTATGDDLTLVDSDAGGVTLPSVTLSGGTGFVSLTAGGDITVTTMTGLGATLAMNGGSTGSLSLTATTVVSDLSSVTLTGVNAALVLTDAGNRAIALGTSSLSGTFSLSGTAVEAVSQIASTKLTIAGQVTIDTSTDTTDADVTLSNIGNTFGSLVVNADDLSVREEAATDFGASTITASLTVVSSGAVTDSGTVTVDTTTSVTATGNNITLDSAANSFDGALTLTGANVTIVDDTTTVLTALTASGTFTLTTVGNVSEGGNVVVGGLATITTSGNIDLDTSGNTINFGSLSLSGVDIDITEDSASIYASVSASTLDAISTGSITDSGTLTVSGAASFDAGPAADGLEKITLDDLSNNFGTLALDGGTVTIVENSGTDLIASDVDGYLTVTSSGNIVHSAGILTVLGVSSFNANSGTGSVTLSAGTNNFGSISVTAGSATIDEDSSTDLATTSVTGAFNLTSTAAVSDSGVLTLGGATVITATGNVILDKANSTFNSVDVQGASVTLLAYSALTIVDADATAGDLIIVASGAIIDSSSSINSNNNIFIQAGMDSSDPTRELLPAVSADSALLNSLVISGTDPVFGGTETYVGSLVSVT